MSLSHEQNIPEISVIIPVFNDEYGLDACLQRLSSQSIGKHRFEVLVIDNGSKRVPTNIIARYTFARLLQEPLPGSYAARNLGIKHARGQYFAFTDADCLPTVNWLEKSLNLFAQHGDIVIVGSIVMRSRINGQPNSAELYQMMFMSEHQVHLLQQRHYGSTANLVANRQVFYRVGEFSRALKSGGDLEWGQRVYQANIPQVYCQDVIVEHPARNTLLALCTQAQRVAGGRYQLRSSSHNNPSVIAAKDLTLISSLWQSIKRVLFDQHPDFTLSVYKRFGVFAIGALVRIAYEYEMIRLKLGGCPRR